MNQLLVEDPVKDRLAYNISMAKQILRSAARRHSKEQMNSWNKAVTLPSHYDFLICNFQEFFFFSSIGSEKLFVERKFMKLCLV